jgi:hypothetical protein
MAEFSRLLLLHLSKRLGGNSIYELLEIPVRSKWGLLHSARHQSGSIAFLRFLLTEINWYGTRHKKPL